MKDDLGQMIDGGEDSSARKSTKCKGAELAKLVGARNGRSNLRDGSQAGE